MNNQLDRYKARRAACTLPDGGQPYCWWKRYQRHIGQAKTLSEAGIQRDAARHAEKLAAPEGSEEP